MIKSFGILSFLLSNIFASQLIAETWSCSYYNNNKLRKYIITREGNALVTPQGSRNEIFYEDEKVIFAYDHYAPKFKNFFALHIDKEKRMFYFTSIETGVDPSPVSGSCLVY